MENSSRFKKVKSTTHTLFRLLAIYVDFWFFCSIFSDHGKEKRRKRANNNNNNNWYKSSEDLSNGSDRQTCRTRYQQTPIEIYARFIAVDQVSSPD